MPADPLGTLITTLEFEALSPTDETPVGFLRTGGDPPLDTIVFDGLVPNLDVTGELLGATIQIVPAPSTLIVLAAMYRDDAMLLGPRGDCVQGREAIDAYRKRFEQ